MANRFSMSLVNDFGTVIRALDEESNKRIKAATIEWHGAVVKTLRGSRSGKTYLVPGTEREYTASAPGEAPAVRTGDLRTSYRFVVKKGVGLVGSPLHYALDLEKGTYKVKPRPHLLASFIKNRAKIMAHFTEGPWV